jgi:16S rRNA (guanine527-N7)-methyltransferase
MSLADEVAEQIGRWAPCDATAAQAFVDFIKLLGRWNQSIRLVSDASPRLVLSRHIVDALPLLKHLDAARRVVDVGAGGGFPSIPIALLRRDLELTALEPIHKKHAFLSAAKRELGLTSFVPLPERDDQHRGRSDFTPYDAAISRATFAPAEWIERGAELIRPGGIVIAMEVGDASAELPNSERFMYQVGDRTRSLLVWTRPA